MNLELLHTQKRLALARVRLAAQMTRIERQKAALFEQGVHASSQRTQTIRARQIRDLARETTALARTFQLIHKQSLVLAHLIYARENNDALNQGLLAKVDWRTLLQSIRATTANQQAMSRQLDLVLEVLNAPVQRTAHTTDAQKEQGTGLLVTHVPDGDGLEFQDGTRVRYIGIDAPEISGRGGQPEPFAQEAKEFNRCLVVSQRVRLLRDVSDTDRYGRLLRYVYVGNVFVNAELVRTGLATVLSLYPDEKHAAEFSRLEQAARTQRRGLWQKK